MSLLGGVDQVDAVLEGLLGGALERQIDGQADVLARHRLAAADDLDRQARHIHDARLQAAFAGEVALKVRLHTGVADTLKGGIVALLAQFLRLLSANRAQIADDL